MTTPEVRHARKVAAIARSLQAPEEGTFSLQKSGVSHMMPLAGDARARDAKVDLRGLTEILSLDPVGKTCSVESGVTFAELVRQTLAHGLVPRLVPELKTITVGGAVSGCSVESMSFRYGGFHDNALAYEVVTGDGQVLACSRTERPELFEMLHGSYGTLGILTRIDFALTEAKPFVKLTYPKFTTFEDFQRALREACEGQTYDFVDGIIHGPDRFVLCLGQLVDRAPYAHRYDWLGIYYQSTWKRGEDYMPIFDYFFRYDADCHWLSRKVPGLENPIVRFLAGKYCLSSTRLLELSQRFAPLLQRGKRPDVVVDCLIPVSRFEEFFRYYERAFDFYPLWIVPYRVEKPYAFLNDSFCSRIHDQLFIDCAIYGKPNQDPHLDYYALLEDKLFELAGLKALISYNGYSEQRFWQIYSQERYARAKAQADPRGRFRGLYEKVHCRGRSLAGAPS